MNAGRPTAPGPVDEGPAQTPPFKDAPRHSNLYLRVVSTLVLAPLFLAVVWYGGWVFAFVIGLGGILVFHEWSRITGSADVLAGFGGSGLVLAGILAGAGEDGRAVLACVIVAAICLGVALVLGRRPWSAGGVLYAGAPIVAFNALRGGEDGLWAITLLLALTWASDIAAYFVGRTLGGPKLWPAVSPNKTWSGVFGGLVGAGLAALVVSLVTGIGDPAKIVALALVLSIAAQAGDLGESALKRRFGIKDSGTLIPGHGGILDRVDGLVTAAFVAYLIALAAGGGDPAQGLALL